MITPNPKWTPIVARRLTVIRIFATALASMTTVKKYTGIACRFLTINQNELGSVFLRTADIKKLSANLIARIQKNPKFPAQHAVDCLRGCQKFITASRDISQKIPRTGLLKLKSLFQRYYRAYVEFAKFMVIPVAIEQALTAKISAALGALVGSDQAPKVLAKLMTPPILPEFQKEQIALLGISLKPDAEKIKEIARHRARYAWLSCYNIDEAAYDKDYFSRRLNALATESPAARRRQYQELSAQAVADEKVYRQTINELDFTAELKGAIEMLRQYVYLRTYRVEMQSKANYFIQPLFIVIAKTLGLSLRHVVVLKPEEIIAGLSRKTIPSARELEKRCRDYGFCHDEKGVFFAAGAVSAQQLARLELGGAEKNDATEIKGTVAFAGTITGIARVVITKEDILNFKDGEILVTTMTTPEFVPAMKKAIAIVTNEGGVLCHAAIVARELKVPCLIGTGRATKIFATGDKILVDGANGVARKV